MRIARTLLLDHPIAVFMVVLQHEAYGHGGRAREFGAHASVKMGSLVYFVRSRLYPSYYVLVNTPSPINQRDQFYREWRASFTLLTEYRRLRWQARAGLLEPGA